MGSERRELTIGLLGVLIGLLAQMLAASAAQALLKERVGARIRPMGEVVALIYGALVGICGGAVSLMAAQRERTRWLGVTGLILGLSAFPVGLVLLRYVLQLRHLILSP